MKRNYSILLGVLLGVGALILLSVFVFFSWPTKENILKSVKHKKTEITDKYINDLDFKELLEKSNQKINSKGFSPFSLVLSSSNLDNPLLKEIILGTNMEWNKQVFNINESGFELEDDTVNSLRSKNIKLFGTINIKDFKGSNGEEYTKSIQDLIEWYQGRIRHWQIPNYSNPILSSVEYTNIIKKIHTSLKKQNINANLISFGVNNDNLGYFKAVLKTEAINYFDIIAVEINDLSSPFEVGKNIKLIQEIIKLNKSLKKPIWVTNLNTNFSVNVNESRQSYLIARTYITLLANNIENIFWNPLIDDNNGLLKQDITPRKIYNVYSNLSVFLGDKTLIKELNVGRTEKAYLFSNNKDEKVLVLWTFKEIVNNEGTLFTDAKNVEILADDVIEQVTDIYGKSIDIGGFGNSIRLKITNSPVFIMGKFDEIEVKL